MRDTIRIEPQFGCVRPLNLLLTFTFVCGTIILSGIFWFVFESSLLAMSVSLGIGLCLLPFLLYNREPSPIAPVYLTVAYLVIAYPAKLIAVRIGIVNVLEDYPGLLGMILWLFRQCGCLYWD